MPEQKAGSGYTIEPATRGGYHVKLNGRAVRKDHKPLIFATRKQAKDFINQQVTVQALS